LWDRVGVSTYGPAPGYVPGGPDPGYSTDGCCASNSCGSAANNSLCNASLVTPPLGQPIQKSYKDFNTNWPEDSWDVSENGIYYEAAYIKLLSKFIDTTVCTSVVLLATRMISFNAVLITPGTAKVSWDMVNEEDIASYIVEKSDDGANFDSIGYLPNTNSKQYGLFDYNVKALVNFYRLRMVNVNGSFSYSNIVILKQSATNRLEIFPNPAKDQLNLTYINNSGPTEGSMRLIDVYGRSVYEQSISIQTGSNGYSIPLDQLASGVYYLCIKDNTGLALNSSVVKW
jgi:Secretion system C-terminal sorting domain